MHKRITAIFVALALLACVCCIPVSADKADQDLPYIELMDFIASPADGTAPGSFYVIDSYDFAGNFMLLGEMPCYGYEITYSYVGNRPTVNGVSFGDVTDREFNSRYVEGSNIGKVRGSFDGVVGSNFGISFFSTGCYVTIHSFRIFLVDSYQIELSAELYGNGQSLPWYPGSSSSVATTGYGTIEIDSWRNFDTVCVSATLGGYGITSVAARLIDNTSDMEYVIPFEMNYVNLQNNRGEHENVLLTVICDMRGVDPATAPDSTLVISINTDVTAGNYGYIQPTSIYGNILVQSPDKYLPWIKTGYIVLEQTSFYVSSVPGFLDSIDLGIYNGFKSVNQKLDNFSNNVSLLFADFKEFWSSSLSSIIEDWWSFKGEFDLTFWNQFYKPAFDNLADKLDSLISGTPADQEQVDEMTSAGDQLADLGQQMAAGTPQVNTDFDLSIPEVPDDGSGMLASTMFNFFWGQDYIMKMLLTVVALATLSYVFFGKKG